MTSVIIPVLAALLGSLAGAYGSYLGTYKMWNARQKREERRVARALQGEIEAIVRIVQIRDYASELRATADSFRRGQVEPFVVPIRQNYFTVFQAHTEQLGALDGELPRKVAEVYTLAKALVDDFAGIRDTDWSAFEQQLQQLSTPQQQAKLAELANKYDERAQFIDEAMRLASETADQLKAAYGEAD